MTLEKTSEIWLNVERFWLLGICRKTEMTACRQLCEVHKLKKTSGGWDNFGSVSQSSQTDGESAHTGSGVRGSFVLVFSMLPNCLLREGVLHPVSESFHVPLPIALRAFGINPSTCRQSQLKGTVFRDRLRLLKCLCLRRCAKAQPGSKGK